MVCLCDLPGCVFLSLSARRAWIEIEITLQTVLLVSVVALRKESVDRNPVFYYTINLKKAVALRKESVDRNINAVVSYNIQETSLSARRAWIEITEVSRSNQSIISRSPQGERG